MENFVASFLFIGFNALAAQLMRRTCRQILPLSWYPFAAEFVAAFQDHSNWFENNAIRQAYGDVLFVIHLTYMGVLCERIFDGGTGNTCELLQQMLDRTSGVMSVSTRLVIQLGAGVLARYYSLFFWKFGISQLHAELFHTYTVEGCETDLVVPPVFGMFLEFGAVVLCTWIACEISEHVEDERLASTLSSLTGALICIGGMDLTGMYFNPSLATAMSFFCAGISTIEFLAIYWIAPLAGVLFTTYLVPQLYLVSSIKRFLPSNAVKKEKLQ